MKSCVAFLFFLTATVTCWSTQALCNHEWEAQCLQNIQQLTFPWMGFEKAGEAYFSPDGTTIIFQAIPVGETRYQIYTLKLSEELPVMVSTGLGCCTCAYFSPDGQKLLFASSHEAPISHEPMRTDKYTWDLTPYMNIYEAHVDGSDLRPLTFGPAYHAECAYSPTGTHIVFASNESGSMNIYTMQADGSDIQQLTHTSHSYNGGPFFSPDGTRIIFRSDRDKQDYLQIYMMNSDGTHERKLTDNDAVNWAPYWHPNGSVIAYTTSIHGHRQYEIYLLNVDTGVQHRLTHCTAFDGLPSFSRDSTRILWTSKRGSDNSCQIFIADFIMPEQVASKESSREIP